MSSFKKELLQHLKWTAVLLIISGVLLTAYGIFTKELSLSDLSFDYFLKESLGVCLVLLAPYYLLQVIFFTLYKRFYYLTFFSTIFWTPKNFEHEPKDGVFTGLWLVLMIIVAGITHMK